MQIFYMNAFLLILFSLTNLAALVFLLILSVVFLLMLPVAVLLVFPPLFVLQKILLVPTL